MLRTVISECVAKNAYISWCHFSLENLETWIIRVIQSRGKKQKVGSKSRDFSCCENFKFPFSQHGKSKFSPTRKIQRFTINEITVSNFSFRKQRSGAFCPSATREELQLHVQYVQRSLVPFPTLYISTPKIYRQKSSWRQLSCQHQKHPNMINSMQRTLSMQETIDIMLHWLLSLLYYAYIGCHWCNNNNYNSNKFVRFNAVLLHDTLLTAQTDNLYPILHVSIFKLPWEHF